MSSRIGSLLFLATGLWFVGSAARAEDPPPVSGESQLLTSSVATSHLSHPLEYTLYLPPGYAPAGGHRYPVVYLLHGRGDNMSAWTTIRPDLDRLIREGAIPALIAVMPDAPSSRRAGFYVDSEFTGGGDLPPGEAVESAFLLDLIPHIDRTLPTRAERAGRIVAGYSMGGYGALRYSLAHPDLFGAAIALSPAAYLPLPPAASSTREFGAFGLGPVRFVDAIYTAKNYPALLAARTAQTPSLSLFIAVGDDERALPDAAESAHDLDFEAHNIYRLARRAPGIAAELRVLDGGHNWSVWRPGFVEGLRFVFRQPAGAATLAR